MVLSGTREEALQALAGELGERASTVAANLSDAAAVDGLVGRGRGGRAARRSTSWSPTPASPATACCCG